MSVSILIFFLLNGVFFHVCMLGNFYWMLDIFYFMLSVGFCFIQFRRTTADLASGFSMYFSRVPQKYLTSQSQGSCQTCR